MDGEYIKTKTVVVENADTQPIGSQATPDFKAVSRMLMAVGAENMLERLLNSPKALKALGLCKESEIDNDFHCPHCNGFVALKTRVRMAYKESNKLEAELKAVREMRDRLAYIAYEYREYRKSLIPKVTADDSSDIILEVRSVDNIIAEVVAQKAKEHGV